MDLVSEQRKYLYLLEQEEYVVMRSERKANLITLKNGVKTDGLQFSWQLTEKLRAALVSKPALREPLEKGDFYSVYKQLAKRNIVLD